MPVRYALRVVAVSACCAVLFACASKVPQPLRETLPEAPSPRAVQTEPQLYLSHEVRWGGEILGLRNNRETTEIEVYARPLYRDGEPRPEGGESVRFIARIGQFLDPAEFSPGKRLTVRGRLVPAVTRPVGEYPYLFPVVAVDVYNLWPEYRPPAEPVWLHDPYYDPWWPWSPWRPWRPYDRPPYWW